MGQNPQPLFHKRKWVYIVVADRTQANTKKKKKKKKLSWHFGWFNWTSLFALAGVNEDTRTNPMTSDLFTEERCQDLHAPIWWWYPTLNQKDPSVHLTPIVSGWRLIASNCTPIKLSSCLWLPRCCSRRSVICSSVRMVLESHHPLSAYWVWPWTLWLLRTFWLHVFPLCSLSLNTARQENTCCVSPMWP